MQTARSEQHREKKVPQENPVELLKERMQQFKTTLLDQELSAEDEQLAEEIADLPGQEQLAAYASWTLELAHLERNTKKTIEEELVESTRQQIKFETMAMTDNLTGAYSRPFLIDHLGHKINAINHSRAAGKHRREGEDDQNFSILMLDIDYFKQVNDTLGHKAGDMVLKRLVSVLQDHVRDEDRVVRYGGEEFIVVLEASESDAGKVAENLRKAVEEEVSKAMELGEKGTVSIGVSAYGPDYDEKTLDELIEEADEALYHSKRSGRNQVTIYSAGGPGKKTKEKQKAG